MESDSERSPRNLKSHVIARKSLKTRVFKARRGNLKLIALHYESATGIRSDVQLLFWSVNDCFPGKPFLLLNEMQVFQFYVPKRTELIL